MSYVEKLAGLLYHLIVIYIAIIVVCLVIVGGVALFVALYIFIQKFRIHRRIKKVT